MAFFAKPDQYILFLLVICLSCKIRIWSMGAVQKWCLHCKMDRFDKEYWERPRRRAAKKGEPGKDRIWIFDLNWGV